MIKQSSFAELEYQSKKRLTRREVFLNEMEAVMPWTVLMAVIEPHYPKQGNQWYFGMKIHVGADVNSGGVHSVTVTAANQADINELPNLLRDSDEVVFADAGYTSDEYKRGARAMGIKWCVQDKRKPKKNLSSSQRKRNRKQSSVRARVEHIFRVVKQQFGFVKTRYRGFDYIQPFKKR